MRSALLIGGRWPHEHSPRPAACSSLRRSSSSHLCGIRFELAADMKQIVMFESEDGSQLFARAEDCAEYEQRCADVAAANVMLDSGSSLYDALAMANGTRPLWDSCLDDAQRRILRDVTKQYGFPRGPWCSDDNCEYRILGISDDCQVRVVKQFSDFGVRAIAPQKVVEIIETAIKEHLISISSSRVSGQTARAFAGPAGSAFLFQ